MFKLTANEVPYVHYQCGCMREFVAEEMYLCIKCVPNKSICRFCLDEDEIESLYCRFCLDVLSASDAS
jgi:hypothetical protein